MYLSIDIGGTLVKYILLDKDGNFKSELKKYPTPTGKVEFIESLKDLVSLFSDKISGVVVATSGVLNPKTGSYDSSGNFPFLIGENICKILSDFVNLPVSIINDGQAALLGEVWKGELKSVNNGLLLTLGTGLISGLLIDGKLYKGSNQMAGELSFLTLNPKESFFPVKASAVKFIEESHLYLTGRKNQDGHYIFERLYKGDSGLDRIFENYTYELALLIFNIQMLLDLEKVVIAGGIASQPILIENIKESYTKIYKDKAESILGPSKIELSASVLYGHGNLLGGLYHHLNTSKGDC